MSSTDVETLKQRVGQVFDVRAAIGLMNWDQEVYMPPKAAAARGQQVATLSGIAHRLFTDPAIGDLLKRLRDDASLGADEARLVSETLYDYERATKLPEDFVQRFAEERSKAYNAWIQAKKASDFGLFRRNLETVVELSRQEADLLGYEGTPYNALLENYERGMTAERLRPMFVKLADHQSALVDRIMQSGHEPDTSWLDQHWEPQKQWDFTVHVLKDMGYDFEAGRQDSAEHPFTTEFDLYDVRVTTHIYPNDLFAGLMASIHEGGHALYEQGFQETDRRTTLGRSVSLGIHESQSRMWENLVGQSRAFWDHYGDVLRAYFPDQLKDVSNAMIYQAINQVRPTLRRLDADECTYNLHIILRFEIELALIEGELDVGGVPEMWNAKMQQYLGLEVPDDARGCLQDVHWSHGALGYFPTYTLGNLYAAQMFETIREDLPELEEQIRHGNFCALFGWLREHVHRIGRRKLPPEIVQDSTGHEPTAEPYLQYLKSKYGELYHV